MTTSVAVSYGVSINWHLVFRLTPIHRAENGTYIHLWDQLQNQNEPNLLCTETYRLKSPCISVNLE
jgi:hypothetical protein